MTRICQLISFALGFVVIGAGMRLASHGQISWWFLVVIVMWALTTGVWAFSEGWDGRGES